jgi:hypothetical protein
MHSSVDDHQASGEYSGSNQSTIAEPGMPKIASDRDTLLRLTAA